MEPSALSEGPELGEGGPGALERDEEGGVGLPLSPLGGGKGRGDPTYLTDTPPQPPMKTKGGGHRP